MNKKVVVIGIVYSVLVIIYKLIIILGGHQLTKFGFFYSHILSVFAIIPFMYLAVRLVRDKDSGGELSGKEAFAAALGVAGIAIIILSVYTYIEFEWKLKGLSAQYYNSLDYLEFLKGNKNVKPTDYQRIIDAQIESLSAMKAVTAKLFSFLLISISSAFMVGVFARK